MQRIHSIWRVQTPEGSGWEMTGPLTVETWHAPTGVGSGSGDGTGRDETGGGSLGIVCLVDRLHVGGIVGVFRSRAWLKREMEIVGISFF